jgi:hypothetical protein
MANTFQAVDWVTMDTLRLLKNKLQVAQWLNTHEEALRLALNGAERPRVQFPYQLSTDDLPSWLAHMRQLARALQAKAVVLWVET